MSEDTVTLSKEATEALKKYISHRKNHSGWENYDINMAASQLIVLGVMAYETDCWSYASACLMDDGDISLYG